MFIENKKALEDVYRLIQRKVGGINFFSLQKFPVIFIEYIHTVFIIFSENHLKVFEQ